MRLQPVWHRTAAVARPERRGISLVDLVVTVLIMSIIAAVTVPRFTGILAQYKVETAARQIAADLNYARQYARQTSGTTAVLFQFSPPAYFFNGVPALDHSGAAYSVDLDSLGYDVAFSSIDFDGNTLLMFDENGRPSTGSTAAGLTSGSVTVQSGSASRTVVVDVGTGKATIP